MLTDEERKAIERLNIYKEKIKDELYPTIDFEEEKALGVVLNLIEKQSKEIEELKRQKETNQRMIQLAETQILGYGQGYKDGLNEETTAAAIVARERENQIIYEGMKHKINMQWVFKIKAKIEERKNFQDKFEERNMLKKVIILQNEIQILQSLLEKE